MALIKFVLLAAIIGCAYSVGIYEQCAGEGYGTFPCNAGLACFRRNRFYSSCQFSCPRNVGWECEIGLPPLPVSTIAAAFEQCGGDGWLGPRVCAAGYACYTRSVFFSQCRPFNDCPPGWTCPIVATTVAPITGPVILAAYQQCNNVGNSVCIAGTACYKNNDAYWECRSSCPATWACATNVVGAFEQCGGDGWVGSRVCAAGYTCYTRSAAYSQCRPFNDCPTGWSCPVVATTVAPVTGPVILAAYQQCNNVGNSVCIAGTACYKNNDAYWECRSSCPATWACATDVVGAYEQCGGDGWVGSRVCAAGYTCYTRSAAYSQCRPLNDCPPGWSCPIVATTVAPITGPVILAAYQQCNNVGNATCIAGTACYKNNDAYWECRPSCPATWACATDVVGAYEQCGGDGYTGITRCAEGLRCYVRNQVYAHCAATCPGAGWIC